MKTRCAEDELGDLVVLAHEGPTSPLSRSLHENFQHCKMVLNAVGSQQDFDCISHPWYWWVFTQRWWGAAHCGRWARHVPNKTGWSYPRDYRALGAHGMPCTDEDDRLLGAGAPCLDPLHRGREKVHWDPSEQWTGSMELAFLCVCLFVDATATDGSSASPGAGFPYMMIWFICCFLLLEKSFHSQ